MTLRRKLACNQEALKMKSNILWSRITFVMHLQFHKKCIPCLSLWQTKSLNVFSWVETLFSKSLVSLHVRSYQGHPSILSSYIDCIRLLSSHSQILHYFISYIFTYLWGRSLLSFRQYGSNVALYHFLSIKQQRWL